MKKRVLFYIIAFGMLITIFLFFTRANKALTVYSELLNRHTTVYSNFQELSRQVNHAAIANPELNQVNNLKTRGRLFFTDSMLVLHQLNQLRSVVSDSVNVRIAEKLEEDIRKELSWLLNSNVPDSFVHQRALEHLASFERIDSLIRQGIQRASFLIGYRKKQLDEKIVDVRIWMTAFIVLSGMLLFYITRNLFRQQSIRKIKEKELETVFNRINDSVVSVDSNWRYTFLNDIALSTHPLGKEETLGKVIWDVHPEMNGTIFWDKYHEAMLTKNVMEIEDYYAPMDIWFSVKIYPSDDGLTIFYKDITKNKKAEQYLLQSLREVTDYKFALDESSIVAITDHRGIINHVNDNFCRISKFSAAELIGQDHRIINSGHHPKEFIKNLWVTIANGRIWKGELKNKAKDGTIYWVDTTIVPFLNEEGKPYQYVAIRADITERKLVEENLTQSLREIEDYKYALEESSIVAITDQKGIIRYANDNFCKISKYSREELIGQDHRIINSGHHPKEFIKNLWTTIANGKIWKGELKNKAKDGTIYWVDTTIVPFLDEKGKPYQYVAIRADITERKNAEENIIELNRSLEEKISERTAQLKKSNEEMEAFSYSVSHDLRAPLRGALAFASILDEEYGNKLDEEAKRIIAVIKESTLKMGTLIDDLLTFSRLGKQSINKVLVNTGLMVYEIKDELVQQTNRQQVSWNIDALPQIKADVTMIRQVWINLISNAIKYSGNEEKPVIEIGTYPDGEQVVFFVKDNGAGFDEEYKDKLFKVFQRLHDADEFEGTGVGLALVEKIVSRHEGKVWAEGKEGDEPCFYFSLPNELS
jgi:PAS domain S-box-containing protein